MPGLPLSGLDLNLLGPVCGPMTFTLGRRRYTKPVLALKSLG